MQEIAFRDPINPNFPVEHGPGLPPRGLAHSALVETTLNNAESIPVRSNLIIVQFSVHFIMSGLENMLKTLFL